MHLLYVLIHRYKSIIMQTEGCAIFVFTGGFFVLSVLFVLNLLSERLYRESFVKSPNGVMQEYVLLVCKSTYLRLYEIRS